MVCLCLDAVALALDFKQDILIAFIIHVSIPTSVTKQGGIECPPLVSVAQHEGWHYTNLTNSVKQKHHLEVVKVNA